MAITAADQRPLARRDFKGPGVGCSKIRQRCKESFASNRKPVFSSIFNLPHLFTYLITLVIGITLHEFAHAKVADMLGDNTPRMNGRVTLNPLAHLDPIGSLMMLTGYFGWGRPVPVNPYALGQSSPAALMWVSLAGPATNFLLAIFAAVPLRMGLASLSAPQEFLPSSYSFLTNFIFMNLFLALFNLVPLAPLDGDKIAEYFFPPSIGRVLDVIRPYGPMILILLIFVGPWLGFDFIGRFVSPPVQNLFHLLLG
jgi:Zn-dependent protease